jgi:hypothetical protein
MADSSAIRAGRAFVELFLDDTKLAAGLKRSEQSLRAVGNAMVSVGQRALIAGSGIVASFALAANQFAQTGASLYEMSARTGVASSTLSKLGYAASQAGIDADAVGLSFKGMAKFLGQFATGDPKAAEAQLQNLHLTLGQLTQANPEQRFYLLADAVARIQDPTLRTAESLKVFGKSGDAILPFLAEGPGHLRALGDEATALGLVWSVQDVAAAKGLQVAISTLWAVMKQTVNNIGGTVAPVFQGFARGVTDLLVPLNAWIKANPELFKSALQAGAAIAIAGAAIVAVGTTLQSAAFVLGGFGKAWALVAGLVSSTFRLAMVGAASAIGFLLTPVGAVVGALVAFGAYLIYTSGLAGQAVQFMRDEFASLLPSFTAAWQGIKDAVAGGDLRLAFQIAWDGIKLVWAQGTLYIEEIWYGVKDVILHAWNDAWATIAKTTSGAVLAFMETWIGAKAFFIGLWADISASFSTIWNNVVGEVSKAILNLYGLFDKSFDTEGAKKLLDQNTNADNAKAQNEAKKIRNDSRNEGEKELGDLKGIQDANRKTYQDEADAANAAVDATSKKVLDAKRAEIAGIKAEISTLSKTAAEEAAKASAATQSKYGDIPKGVDHVDNQFGVGKTSTSGTFSSAALFGLGGGSAADRTAKATEQTVRVLQQYLPAAINKTPGYVGRDSQDDAGAYA